MGGEAEEAQGAPTDSGLRPPMPERRSQAVRNLLESYRDGERNFAGHQLQDAELQDTSLVGADFRNAVLHEANLTDSDLKHARLQHADLTDARLQGAKHLLPRQFAGADLTRTQLPDGFPDFPELRLAELASNRSRNLFFSMLAASVYTFLTIGMTRDLDMLLRSKPIELPVVGVPIPIIGFYVVAPFLLVANFAYFQFHLNRLWARLANLPAIFPDGRRLDDLANPWLLTGLLAEHMPRLARAGNEPLALPQRVISVALAFWVVPLTLYALWGRALGFHDALLTGAHFALTALAVGMALGSWLWSRRTLAGGGRQVHGAYLRGWLWGASAAGLCLVVLLIFSRGAATSLRPNGDAGFTNSYWFGYFPQHEIDGHAANVQGGKLTGADMFGSVLTRADLSEADLSHADLGEADLRGADLSGALLDGTTLERAQLDLAKLQSVDLRTANLNEATFLWAKLGNANLSKMVLDGLDFRGASFQGADLTDASLMKANLERASFKGATMVGVRLEGAKLSGSHLEGVELEGAALDGAELIGANLEGASLVAVEMPEAKMERASLKDARLSNVDAFHLRAEQIDLRRADLTNATLTMAYLVEADMREANLRRAHLDQAILQAADLRRADLTGATLRGALLKNADLRGATLQGASLPGTQLFGADLRLTDVTTEQLAQACGDGDTRLPPGVLLRSCLEPEPTPSPDPDRTQGEDDDGGFEPLETHVAPRKGRRHKGQAALSP